ncbi:hypothetical protein LNTAR_04866 [Lentisphaera araneosa HTCC2155]|uniref:Uncharacterized protein n=1 Tax=Lentisphaera araneosa HTCC2155 TaxID=313628 RepID=A6DLG0_9BACT|nr:prepilin-type N-terminal cleavage/methylation domain-containing protein [Lentisphaera araneosa]EDM27415.1 hypothetical protein LNTAR_04866 [Lentisphaera araneosa HTCC2155]
MKHKFTLIELLLVVAIIGILASLLLPTLGKARKTSQQAVCKSQQKQLGSAIYMYVDDNEYMPSASHPTKSSRLGWKVHLGPYINSSGDGSEGGAAPFRCPNSELGTGYTNQEAGTAYNIKMGDDRYPARPAVKLDEIESAVQTGVISDSVDGTDWVIASKLLPSEDAVGYRHKNGLNILWADGHVQWFTTVAIQAGKNGTPDWYYEVSKP